jgi:hypothetical protein
MLDPTPDFLHEAVQKALLGGDFDSARRLSAELGKAIIRHASAVAPANRAAFVREGLSRLEENLSLARVLRAHIARQVQANSAVCLYHQGSGRGNSWCFDA